MKKKSGLNLCYVGSALEARILHDGGLVVLARRSAAGVRTLQVLVDGGPHRLDTLHALDVRVLAGPCTLKCAGAKARVLAPGARLRIEAGEVFTLKARTALLRLVEKPGPGLGDDDDRDDNLGEEE